MTKKEKKIALEELHVEAVIAFYDWFEYRDAVNAHNDIDAGVKLNHYNIANARFITVYDTLEMLGISRDDLDAVVDADWDKMVELYRG